MRVLQLTDQGSDNIAISEVPKPLPTKGQVLVRLKAAALNHRDQWCREGKYPALRIGSTLGSDGAGVVKEVGESVNGDWVGKEVIINPNINWGNNPEVQGSDYHILGMPSDGTFAEYIVVDESRVLEKPSHLSFEEAAALPLGGMTAYRALIVKGGFVPGKKVLVTGIGGGVSQFVAVFLRALGGEYYVTSGSEEKLDKALTLGAKGGYNYKSEGWWKEAAKETGGFDIIVDSAGGDLVNNYLRLIKPGGTVVFYGSTAGTPKSIDMFRLFWSQATIAGSTMANDQEFSDMVQLVNDKGIKPIIDSVRDFDQIVSAFDEMKEGRQFGKLVVKID